MLWRPLRKYIISTFPIKTAFIYYKDLHSGFGFLLVCEYSNDKCVGFLGQKISHGSHTRFWTKNKGDDDDVCVCVYVCVFYGLLHQIL